MLIPILHRILVTPEKVEEVDDLLRRAREAGIEVQLDKREEKAVAVATVVSIGDTAFKDYNATIVPSIGDKVYFAKYAGAEVRDGSTSYLMLNDEDIIAIIKED